MSKRQEKKGCRKQEISIEDYTLPEMEEVNVEPEEKKIHTGADVASYLVYWTIDPSKRNNLYYRKRPLIVDEITIDLDPFGWRAGGGWPLYTEACPNPDDGGRGFTFPRIRRHGVVAIIGGQRRYIWEICSKEKDYWFGPTRGGVTIQVNDDKYSDNTGSFDVNLYEVKPPLPD